MVGVSVFISKQMKEFIKKLTIQDAESHPFIANFLIMDYPAKMNTSEKNCIT
jgi:phosphopantothenoylcysteine synthetase/decarboxylase